ncbi:MAG TPA: glycosyltransferase [Sphingobium sp.]|nr:glycosyltransferase [Sphingobium sp.]
MRILTFLHSFEPGGVERVALRLVRQWRGEGVDAPLFLGRASGVLRDELAGDIDFHLPRQPRFSVAWFETAWMVLTLPAIIRRLRPDVLFCAGNSYTVVAVAMKLLLGSRCPPVLAKISNDLNRQDMPWPARAFYRLWLRIQGRFIDHFVAMAPGLEREIATLIRPRAVAISVIPSPALSDAQIDLLRSLPPTQPRQEGAARRFVTIGRLARQKNLPLMLKAFAQGAVAADRLVIYGEGPERGALIRLADRLGLQGRIEFAGHVPDPAAWLRPGDIFLLSSDYEGVPAVILEALAAGVRIIATDCSAAMRPLLDDGRLGRLVPPGDARAFAQAIRESEALAQDGAASLRQARRFTLEDAAPSYLDAFAAIITASRPGRQERPAATPSHITSMT